MLFRIATLYLLLINAAPLQGKVLQQPQDFGGVELRWTADEFWGEPLLWYQETFKEETGLTIAGPHTWSPNQAYENTVPHFFSPQPSYDLIIAPAQLVGEIAASGGAAELDTYLQEMIQPQVLTDYWQDMYPIYRDNYARYSGKTYGIPLDGDLMVLHYRPSYFEDPQLRRKYKELYGKELLVPQTWKEFDQISRFFSQQLHHKRIYGTQVIATAPWVWSFWYSRAASYGVEWFDDAMEPQIASPQAVAALRDYIEVAKHAQPGTENFGVGGGRLLGDWQAGKLAMAVWFYDLNELAGGSPELREDAAIAPLPGKIDTAGKLQRFSFTPYGRVAFVPNNLPEKRKRAAIYTAFRLSQRDISQYLIADPKCGSDPFLRSHFTKPELFVGRSPFYEQPEPAMTSLHKATMHVQAGRDSMKNPLGQPNWPGAWEYLYSLSLNLQKAIGGQLTPEEALEATASTWRQIRDRLGRDSQLSYFRQFRKDMHGP